MPLGEATLEIVCDKCGETMYVPMNYHHRDYYSEDATIEGCEWQHRKNDEGVWEFCCDWCENEDDCW